MKKIESILTILLLMIVNFIGISQSGVLDNTFATDGKLTTSIDGAGNEVNSVVIQNDGKIVFGGATYTDFTTYNFALVRCNSDGSLDPSFGIDGKVITYMDGNTVGNSLAIQDDGKIIFGGWSPWHIKVARYNDDGALDLTFGVGGTIELDIPEYYGEKCRSIALLSDGKILIGGFGNHISSDIAHFMLVRLNPDGNLDETFGDGGIVIGEEGTAEAMTIQTDGKIVLAGTDGFSIKLLRYNSEGILDDSFGAGGIVISEVGISSQASAVAIQSDGKIITAGTAVDESFSSGFSVVRHNSIGTLDNTFGVEGKVLTILEESSLTKGKTLVIQSNGKIIVGGYAQNDAGLVGFGMVRYDQFGEIDETFGTDGVVITNVGEFADSYINDGKSMALQSDGKIIFGGDAHNGTIREMVVLRYQGDLFLELDEISDNQIINNVFPNPMNGQSTIQLNQFLENGTLTVHDNLGQKLLQINEIRGSKIEFMLTNVSSGIYFLEIKEYNNRISLEKIVIN